IARGSSIYALVIIASLHLRWTIFKLVEQVPWEIRKMLRNPETSKIPEHIKTRIIPMLVYLCKALPLQLDALCM
ncbi:hypothetical protein F4604DRAFT_1548813, partial [Suillus subluteus]